MIKRWWSAKQHICPQSGGFHSHCLLCRVWVCEAKSYRRGWLQSCSTSKDHGMMKNELHLNWVAFYLPGVLEKSCFFQDLLSGSGEKLNSRLLLAGQYVTGEWKFSKSGRSDCLRDTLFMTHTWGVSSRASCSPETSSSWWKNITCLSQQKVLTDNNDNTKYQIISSNNHYNDYSNNTNT